MLTYVSGDKKTAARRAISARFREISNLQFAVLLSVPVMVFLLAVILYPLCYSLWISFRRVDLTAGFHTMYVGLRNYATILRTDEFWKSMLVSLRFMADSTVLTMLLGLVFAISLARLTTLIRTRWTRALVRSLIILPWAISSYGGGIILKYLWRGYSGFPSAIAAHLFGIHQSLDLYSNAKTVIEILAIGQAWRYAPLVAFFLLANIEVIPSRLYDMASIDHLRGLGKFYYVTLPYLRYTLFVFTSIMIVFSLKEYESIYLQTGGGPGIASAVLTYQIYKFSFINFNLGYGSAMSFYLLILMLAITLALFFAWGRKEGKQNV